MFGTCLECVWHDCEMFWNVFGMCWAVFGLFLEWLWKVFGAFWNVFGMFGNDFGFTRIEGEYGFLTHNIHSPGKSGDVQLHNLQSRLILEKSLGSRADLRGGIGLGLSFIDKNLGGENYDGVGFSYDFLLGWSFRVMDNWSINMDYRHYLTAAHENYDRLQGHVVELSTSFDL